MTRGRAQSHILRLLVLAALVPAGAVTASAQGGPPVIGPEPLPFRTMVQPARRRAIEQEPAEERRAVAEPAMPQPLLDPTQDPEADPEEQARPPHLRRRPVTDGEPTWPAEPQLQRDGIIETEPTPAPDGADPTADTRDPEELAAFDKPRAGFDPEAFAIELEPILDRRPGNLYRFEPYVPIGMRLGSFVMFTDTEIAAAGFSNLFRSSANRKGDLALELRPTIRIVSDWRVHALEFRATGLNSFHADFPSEDDRTYAFEARGRLDITRRTNIEAMAGYERTQESRGSINAPSGAGARTDIDAYRAQIALNQRFNRVAVQLRGSLTQYDYGAVETAPGVVLTNADRDYQQRQGAVRASYELKPTLGLFGEVEVLSRAYKTASLTDNIRRDSTGERYRAGLSFGNASQILRGEVALGWATQSYDDARLASLDGIIVDANFAWRLTSLTSLLFTARTDIAETTLADTGGGVSHTAGLELRHAFKRNLIATAGVKATTTEYRQAHLTEREIDGTAGLEYYLNRNITLFGRYQHMNFESQAAGRSYDADEVRLGFRFRQ